MGALIIRLSTYEKASALELEKSISSIYSVSKSYRTFLFHLPKSGPGLNLTIIIASGNHSAWSK